MPLTPTEVELAVEGLMFLQSLSRSIGREAIEQALEEPVLFPSLPELPSWLQVKEYIQKHPEFLTRRDLREAWKNRDKDPYHQLVLIKEFAQRIQGKSKRRLYAFAPEVRDHSVLKTILSESAGEAVNILNNTSCGKSQKQKLLRKLLTKTGGKHATPSEV